jgi:predicted O-methyltransferase YrrM
VSLLFQTKAFLLHQLQSVNRHGVHSPFVFDLMNTTFPDQPITGENKAELWREKCLNNSQQIHKTDFGTGASGSIAISTIAKRSLKPARTARLLHRLVQRFQPQTILELGTSLGVTALYLQQAQPQATVTTLEGCPETAAVAQRGFDTMQLPCRLVVGSFEEQLKQVLHENSSPDFIFIDGNHRYEPTINYYQTIKPYLKDESVLVFDDIHWSEEMERAWNSIIADEDLHCTMDLFDIGIVMLRPQQRKEHFILRW